jgi:hypothetical protein
MRRDVPAPAHYPHFTETQEIIMSKYRVPLTVAATVSTTLFVEAATAAHAMEAARTALLAGGRVLLQADPPHEAALREAVVTPGEAVAEIFAPLAYDVANAVRRFLAHPGGVSAAARALQSCLNLEAPPSGGK